MSELRIVREKRIAGSDAILLFPAYWQEQFDQQTISKFNIPIHDSYRVIVAYLGASTVGFILFTNHDPDDIWIMGSYVIPVCRRKGYFILMFDELKKLATEEKFRRVGGATFDANDAMKAAYKATGRVKHSETWYYNLPQEQK